ncbi:ATPase, T2SS/T4P/T4SS family [Paenibacillus sp. IHBB 10380]|uniref:ATPase, T2SS/T4P/T4SS family n=1 Tax=Paenibacillus sp. IHBB 10380 TaxID=1566358 RepID=UPI0005CF92FE|nr:ATPase, T2SS/T4P/T4SS family [Paenibacillus sp. IHBB 10380]AJS58332.1 pilus assembly protein CpaF [Paenibacillus sp. IHBB 10380]
MLFGNGVNLLIIGLILLFAGLFIYIKYLELRNPVLTNVSARDKYTIDSMTDFVKTTLHELTHSQLSDLGLHEEEYKRRLNKRSELRKALKGCISGDLYDKQYVKQFMADLLVKSYGLDATSVDVAIPFEQSHLLNVQDQFEIVLYLFCQRYHQDAFSQLLEKYNLDKPRIVQGYGDDPIYAIVADDIHTLFHSEYRVLSFEEKVEIVVQRIYQQYKGFSVVDELRDQRIDGVSGGVNGVSGYEAELDGYVSQNVNRVDLPVKGIESVWVFYKGKSIHLGFLSFGSELELKRVCQNIYKYNYPGQLSEAASYKVNEMKDGSRVVVVRPPFAESWAFFVRKFDVPNASLSQLINGVNAELPITLISYLMKGSRITAVTGAQGSGKTTLLMAMIQHIYASYTLRVQEMAFELHLRKIYSRRNILSFRETEHISGQAGLDLQKKTDGTVNILGEVASDEVASWMIQMSQVASLFTVFTHHAKTFKDLIHSLRNSLLKSGVFHNEAIAEQQVVSVINFDIHMKRDSSGNRFIERITECIPREHTTFPEWKDHGGSTKQMLSQFMKLSSQYYQKMGDQTAFTSHNIVEYRDGEYVVVNDISDWNRAEMLEHMSSEDAAHFQAFTSNHWGERNVS